MYEIQNIHPFDPHLISGLERWLTRKCHDRLNSENLTSTKQNDFETNGTNTDYIKNAERRDGEKVDSKTTKISGKYQ